MKIPVLIEPVQGHGYRASGLGPGALAADGATEADALHNLRAAIEGRLRAGARLAYLELAIEGARLSPAAGILEPNDPLVAEWKETMAENRRRDDASPDRA